MLLELVPLALVVIVPLVILYSRRTSQHPRFVTYKISTPAYGNKPDNSQRLAVIIQKLLSGLPNKTFAPKASITFEAIYSGHNGTGFYVTAPLELSSAVRNHLIAYWPKLELVKVREGAGYRLPKNMGYKLSEWRTGDSFPVLEELNPVEALADSFSDIADNEAAGWQLIICSAKPSLPFHAINSVLRAALAITRASLIIVSDLASDPVAARQRALDRTVKFKIQKSTDSTSFKLCARSFVAAETGRRLKTLNLALMSVLKAHGLQLFYLTTEHEAEAFANRSMGRTFIGGKDSISQLFDFPAPSGSWQEDAEVGLSQQLNATISHRRAKPQVVLGLNTAKERMTAIGLSASECEKHTLVIGGTGMGKSTLLAYSFIQDMLARRGAALIDPHGELARSMLKFVPNPRLRDVIFLDPSDVQYPVALNLMELPHDLDKTELGLAKDFICEAIVSILRKLFSDDDSGGHRIEYILRNTIHTAFNVKGATLFTLHKLLTNDLYRASVVSALGDDSLKDFWYGEFAKAGNYQRVKMISGVTAKLGRFQRSLPARRMLEYPHSTIDFAKLLADNKILICNLNKGSIGEDTANLIGMVVLAKLQLASWQRSLVNTKARPYEIYVDEFQNFNTPIFLQLISEARKFGLYLTIAEQTTAYQGDEEANILLANVGNVISFRTAADLDMRRLGPLFKPYIPSTSLTNLEPFHFYLKSSADKAMPPVSAETILIKGRGSQAAAEKAIQFSHKLYSYPYVEPVRVTKSPRIPLKTS